MKTRLATLVCGLSLCLPLSLSTNAQTQPPLSHSPSTLSRYEGFTEPSRELAVESYLDGVLETLHVKTGDTFAAGDVLVSLDDDIQALAVEIARLQATSTAEISIAQDRVDEAQVEVEDQVDLLSSGGANERDVRRARVSLAIAQAELLQAHENQAQAVVQHQIEQAKLERYRIHAPFDGEVLEIATQEGAEEGAALRQNDPIMRIAQLDPLVAKISLPQAIVDQLQVGQSYPLSIGTRQNTTRATLTRIASEADAGSQLIEVEFEVPNADRAIRSGVLCRLQALQVAERDAE